MLPAACRVASPSILQTHVGTSSHTRVGEIMDGWERGNELLDYIGLVEGREGWSLTRDAPGWGAGQTVPLCLGTRCAGASRECSILGASSSPPSWCASLNQGIWPRRAPAPARVGEERAAREGGGR